MNNSSISLIASSAANLKAQLTALQDKGQLSSTYVNLMVYGEKTIVYLFDVKSISNKELNHYINLEAKKMLSLIQENAAFDYQVFHSEGDFLQGVLIGMPEGHLNEYLEVLDQAKLTPLQITPYFCSSVNSFMQQAKEKMGESCCFLDVSRPEFIQFIFYNRKKCEILRQIHYDHPDEAKKEIVQSLLSALGKSSVKKIDQIYWHGDVHEKDELIDLVKKQFNTNVIEYQVLDLDSMFLSKENYFKLNFVRKLSLGLPQRESFLKVTNFVLVILAISIFAFGVGLIQMHLGVKKMSGTYTIKNLDYAKKLEGRMK